MLIIGLVYSSSRNDYLINHSEIIDAKIVMQYKIQLVKFGQVLICNQRIVIILLTQLIKGKKSPAQMIKENYEKSYADVPL